MKLSHTLVFGALGLTLLASPTFAEVVIQDHPATSGLVNDFAHELTPNQQAMLEAELRQLERDTEAEVAVVTVPSLQGLTIEDYSHELFTKWGIGKKGAGNGVLFLTAPNDHHQEIKPGVRLQGFLTDAECFHLLRSNYHPHALQHDVPGAIVATTQAIDQTLRENLTPKENDEILSHEKPKKQEGSSVAFWIFIVLIGAISGLGLMAINSFRRRRTIGGEADFADTSTPPPLDERPRHVYGGGSNYRSAESLSPRTEESSLGTGLMAAAAASITSNDDEDDSSSTRESRSAPEPDEDISPSSDGDTSGFSFGGDNDEDGGGDNGGGASTND